LRLFKSILLSADPVLKSFRPGGKAFESQAYTYFERLFLLPRSLLRSRQITVINWNMGMNIATTMNPTMPPINTISKGSSREVNADRVASTSMS